MRFAVARVPACSPHKMAAHRARAGSIARAARAVGVKRGSGTCIVMTCGVRIETLVTRLSVMPQRSIRVLNNGLLSNRYPKTKNEPKQVDTMSEIQTSSYTIKVK